MPNTISNISQVFRNLPESQTPDAAMIVPPVNDILYSGQEIEYDVEHNEDGAVITFDMGGYELETVTGKTGEIIAMYYDGAQGSYELVGAEHIRIALESQNLFDDFSYKIKSIVEETGKKI